jgi:transposase
LLNVNKNTAAYYFNRLREIIFQTTEEEALFSDEIEVDESCLGGVSECKRGRGAAGKVPVFGLLKRDGRIYAKVIPDTKSKILMSIIEKRNAPDSIVYSDGYHSYNVLDVSEFKHYRVNQSKLFSDKPNHI